MNNRQASALKEAILGEERAKQQWMRTYGNTLGQSRKGWSEPEPEPQQQDEYMGLGVDDLPDNFGSSYPAQPDIYDRALRVSSPRMVGEYPEHQYETRRVVRQVEVPYSRQVKVPTKTKRIVPTRVRTRVPVRKLVEVPSYKMVDEEYTDYVDQESFREKEVWVKKIVKEPYTKRVPVVKTRMVKVPCNEIEEREAWEEVEITKDEIVEEDGFRVDTVEDTKLVEVEELQNYQFHPQPVGPADVLTQTDLRTIEGDHRNRTIGRDQFSAYDPRLQGIDYDAYPPQQRKRSQSHKGRSRKVSSSSSSMKYKAPPVAPLKLGMKLANSKDMGVTVLSTSRFSPSENAGIQKGDLITRLNNRVVRSLAEFRSVINTANYGPLLVEVVRRGGVKVHFTIHR